MKASNLSFLTSLILKLVGIILVLSYLIEVLSNLLATNFQANQAVLTLITQLVDRGFLPLVGLAAFFTSCWIDEVSVLDATKSRSQGLRLTALWLSSVLGLLFLLNAYFSFDTTYKAATEQIGKINQEGDKLRSQLDTQVQQFKAQVDAQLSMLDQAIKGGQVQGDQLAQAKQQQEQLQKFKSDPKALEAQVAPERDKKLKEIEGQQKQLMEQTWRGARQTGMRLVLNSLLLAIGYATVGWVGLRQMFLR